MCNRGYSLTCRGVSPIAMSGSPHPFDASFGAGGGDHSSNPSSVLVEDFDAATVRMSLCVVGYANKQNGDIEVLQNGGVALLMNL